MQKIFAVLLTVWVLGGCATHDIVPADVSDPEVWGGASNVTQLKHLYFSEQPDEAALKAARSRGVTTVINLRSPGETEWNEKEVVEQMGLEYVNIPIRKKSDTLDQDAIKAISKAVAQQGGRPVLLHCSSGNRASAWLAVHLVDDHDLDVESALGVARKTGLTSDSVEERVRTYLSDR